MAPCSQVVSSSRHFIDFGTTFLDSSLIWGGPEGALGRHLAPSGHQVGAMGVIFLFVESTLHGSWTDFWMTFQEKLYFLDFDIALQRNLWF